MAQEAGTCRSSIGTAVDEHEGSGAGGAVAAGMDCGGTKKASAGASNTDDSEGGDKTLLTLKSGETCHAEQVEGLLLKEIPALDGYFTAVSVARALIGGSTRDPQPPTAIAPSGTKPSRSVVVARP